MMFEWVPLNHYSDIFYLALLFLVLITYFRLLSTHINSFDNKLFSLVFGSLLLIFILLYIGFRPISGVFVDMKTYANRFNSYLQGAQLRSTKDIYFQYFTYFATKIIPIQIYFFICAAIYILPLWYASKKWTGQLRFYLFLLFVVSFSFWDYGTNGIRSGMASSLFILAMSRDNWKWRAFILFLSVSIHKSMALPIIGYLLAYGITKPKLFLYFWLLCIPVSLVAGTSFQSLFGFILSDNRTSDYFNPDSEFGSKSSGNWGFRWDFLIYSASAIVAGSYYIFKKNYKDHLYQILFCTYAFVNGIWILVIRVPFSNRFAYLSWFMMAIIIGYPLLKDNLLRNQNIAIANIMMAYFGFTFFMEFVYYVFLH